MKPKAVMLQPFGLGDNIFTITLCNLLIQDGYEIIYPVQAHFIEGLQRAYPHINWVSCKEYAADYNCKEDKVINGVRHIPIRWSDGWNGTPYTKCMSNKYEMYGLDWHIWRDGAMWQRDEAKEESLYQMLTGGKTPYRLVNDTFGSELKHKVNIPNSASWKTIRMSAIDGYSLFDWAKVIENATEIHTVSTSIIYILEMLELKCKEVNLYNRPIKGQGLDNIDYILERHKYVFHG